MSNEAQGGTPLNLTADGSTEWVDVAKKTDYGVECGGDLGGGTWVVEKKLICDKPAAGDTTEVTVQDPDGTGAKEIDRAGHGFEFNSGSAIAVRVTLSGATSPDAFFWFVG